jgi:FAD/FMN-containing dehydrogenase
MGAGEPSETEVSVARERLEAFEHRFSGRVVLPAAEDYDEARAVWNGMIDRRPEVIARVSDVRDVVEALRFARENDLPVSVRGGGHNVAGTAIAEGGLVIDLSSMTEVHVDADARVATVGGGATIGDVDRETTKHGLAAPLGVVSATGIAGLTLNGGLGHLRRRYGMSCDNLRAVEIVTADGEVRRASATENADLFWALRGGGGNFGVVTTFEFDLHPVEEVFALFVWFPADEIDAVIGRFREWATDAPREANILPFHATVPALEEFPKAAWGVPAVVLYGGYLGSEADARESFAPLLSAAEPLVDLSGTVPYTELQTMLDEDYPDGLRYYWKSVYVSALDDAVIGLVKHFGEHCPSVLSTVDLWHLGGAIADVAPEETAIWHREEPYLLTFEANWEAPGDDDVNIQWARDGVAAARALPVASGEYGNFPGMNEDPARIVYGDNYERLVEVKTKYDPENVFRLNTNIEPRA